MSTLPSLSPIPHVPQPLPEASIPLGNIDTFPEVRLDLPITPGPFEPTWESIEQHYPGVPDWFGEAKFGIWVHFGPQAAGESGDWYARRMYVPGTTAYQNHCKRYGHPTQYGYKELLRDWNPAGLDPKSLVKTYRQTGADFLLIQAVHHDQFDLWDSRYQPWNSVNLGPKRDLLGEWAKACREAGMRFGLAFHHEYSWWWWQTAFDADSEGPLAGVPYDGHLTLQDGMGQWWEGLDPRLLYGIDLREYQSVAEHARTGYRPPNPGVFTRHLEYARWYASWWALRIMDAVEKYDPDFIYTDGNDQQPFSGSGTGTGIKADAMQRVIADYYNRTLSRRKKLDVFSIVKFRRPTRGTVTTEEHGLPREIKSDQPWIAEAPIGDWFYAPGFDYSPVIMVRYLIEAVSRGGNTAICVSLRPDGTLDPDCHNMLQQVGQWMKQNRPAIQGGLPWKVLGEGQTDEQGRLLMIPGRKLSRLHAQTPFDTSDFRFIQGKEDRLYAICLAVPRAGQQLTIRSLGTASPHLSNPIRQVNILGTSVIPVWNQNSEGLTITWPHGMPCSMAVTFEIQ